MTPEKKPFVLMSFTDLKEKFEESKFPIFAKLSDDQSIIYRQLADLWGMVVIDVEKQAVKLDYSWATYGTNLYTIYHQLHEQVFQASDLEFHELGKFPEGIECVCTDVFKGFAPYLNNQVVVINESLLNGNVYKLNDFNIDFMRRLCKSIGVVVKIEEKEPDCMVAFGGPSVVKTVVSVPRSLLIRLPEAFRTINAKRLAINKTTQKQESVHKKSTHHSKFKVGSIVRANAAVSHKALNGLMGVVTEVIHLTSIGYHSYSSAEYKVDFGTIPTMSLLHSVGESPCKLEQTLREFDIEDFDYDQCSMPHLLLFTTENRRREVWLCSLQTHAVVSTTANPREINNAIHFEIEIAGGKKFTVPHYSLDYEYDPTALLKSLKLMKWTTFGMEQAHDRSWLYLYCGVDDKMREIMLRIRLGALKKTPSVLKRFEHYTDFCHPYQLKRYLTRNSLGNFWQAIKASDYIGNVPEFVDIEQETLANS